MSINILFLLIELNYYYYYFDDDRALPFLAARYFKLLVYSVFVHINVQLYQVFVFNTFLIKIIT
jgi:hypothetical protein